MKTIKIALWAAFTIAFLFTAVSLIGLNQDQLSVEIFNYATPMYPKWVVLLSCIFIGAIISTLFFLFELVILETRNVRLRRLNQKLERALAASVGGPSGIRSTAASPQLEDSDV